MSEKYNQVYKSPEKAKKENKYIEKYVRMKMLSPVNFLELQL